MPATTHRVYGGTVTMAVTWVVSEEDSGVTLFAVTSPSVCGAGSPDGDGGRGPPPGAASERSEETRLVVSRGGLASPFGDEPLCAPGTAAVRGELDGIRLNDGTAWRAASCADCLSSCRRAPGCDTWVWGAPGGGAAAGECWHKKAATADGAVTLRAPLVRASESAAAAAGAVASSPYISGEASANPPCEGDWGVQYGGEDLNDGAAAVMTSCAACAAACRRRPGCNVWAYGVAGYRSAVARQCWLRRVADAASPPRLRGGVEWLSGVIESGYEGGEWDGWGGDARGGSAGPGSIGGWRAAA